MNTETKSEGSNSFIRMNGGKSQTNTIDIPNINLPKGGGAIKGIDEKFTVNAANGTAAFSIPLPFSTARGASPSLSLSYNSGAGNSIFGMGWNLQLASIRRKTEKAYPQYLDTIDSDVFLFSEAEDLVPELKRQADGSFYKNAEGEFEIRENDSPDGLFRIRYYRPRIEGLFARIERWSRHVTGEIKWRMISKDNQVTLFGWTVASRVVDPEDPRRIFEWLPEFIYDDRGNCAHYFYKPEDTQGIDLQQINNRNRVENGVLLYTNLYLQKICYGNKTAYKQFNDPFPAVNNYVFQTIFDYGEYNLAAPYQENAAWLFRKDAFSEYRAGFEIRTTRLCRRVLLFHFFNELPGGNALVRSADMEYDTTGEGFSFLKSVTHRGYIKQNNGNYTQAHLPALEFGYEPLSWNTTVKEIMTEDLVHAPSGPDELQYHFVDLYNEGLSGILTEQGEGWYYKQNLGDGHFTRAHLVAPKPSFNGIGSNLQLMELDANGKKQMVQLNQEPKGFFEISSDREWKRFQSFEQVPNIPIGDDNQRMVDLTGDGRPEILMIDDHVFTWYESAGTKGFSSVHKTIGPFDEEKGPRIIFSDPTQAILLADMNGDGMADLVTVKHNSVAYWPNLGYGKFGRKVSMDDAPFFETKSDFNPSQIRVADLDGSGTADLVYLGENKFSCWMNLSGNAFSKTPFEIDPFFEIHSASKVTVTDLLGNGVACIVWSSGLEKHKNAPLKYIDLMNGKKPHLLNFYQNNLGKEVRLEYKPSTHYYLDDQLAGEPWITQLHFPVHCISKTETLDVLTGAKYTRAYTYHHGYYDYHEKEFRGFGCVEQLDSESFEHWSKGGASNVVDQKLHQPPSVTRTWHHSGAFLEEAKILGQFENEYWYEVMNGKGYAVTPVETPLPDAAIITGKGVPANYLDHLSGEEWREAIRACKGMGLRSELFVKDAPETGATAIQLEDELKPFRVSTHNVLIELIQPKGPNRHAVFIVKESEAIHYSYERNIEDARISHQLNIKIDEYGNVLESATVIYPRLAADGTLPTATQLAQQNEAILYNVVGYTNPIDELHHYRLPGSCEQRNYELKGISKSGILYLVEDFDNVLTTATETGYQNVWEEPLPGTTQKRLIEHSRTLFYKNDLTGALPLREMEWRGILFEQYQLAYTNELTSDLFQLKVNAAILQEGFYTHTRDENFAEDDDWWMRSGTMQYKTAAESVSDAANRFFLPISFTDPYGAITRVKYETESHLLVKETEDALSNISKVLQFNWRTLAPQRIQDINENITESLSDELGQVKAFAIFGKGNEADDLTGLSATTFPAEHNLIDDFFLAPSSDQLVAIGKNLLQHATARFIYDLHAYKNSGGTSPGVVASIIREEHFAANNDSKIQLSFEYSSGMGEVILKKSQAEPGLAKELILNANLTYAVNEIDTALLVPAQLRWLGNGRAVKTNKGKTVLQYEPYFSTTHRFENAAELVETGVTPIMYYDALGRLTKIESPDGSFSKIIFDSWKSVHYDANDTLRDTDDSWYQNRKNRLIDTELIASGKDPAREKLSAEKAFRHGDTPVVWHMDSQGRPVTQVEHLRDALDNDLYYFTHALLDVEGNLRKITDPKEQVVMEYKYDMLGNPVFQKSMDAGRRWMIQNTAGNPLRTWDDRSNEFIFEYDILQRPILKRVRGGDGPSLLDHVFEKIIYGETLADALLRNVRGKPIVVYDTAGKIVTDRFDFKSNLLQTQKRFTTNYKDLVNWSGPGLDVKLETETFTTSFTYDAINRVQSHNGADGTTTKSIYNQTGLLEKLEVTQNGNTETFVENIDYNERGSRSFIRYGNKVKTRYLYDYQTFRLNQLETKKQNGDPLQDLHYSFDAAGNVTFLEDKNIPLVFFNNQKISGVFSYTYDALYRLIECNGREHSGQTGFGTKDNFNDATFLKQYSQGDAMAWRNYSENYVYDKAGNITEHHHHASGNDWVRTYQYHLLNNRLLSTTVGTETYSYTHHPQHGFITALPHTTVMKWNFKDQLVCLSTQSVLAGSPEQSFYIYDGSGQRVRKITERQAAAGGTPSRKSERIYLGGVEVYREYDNANVLSLERKTFHVMDDKSRIAMIETRTTGMDNAPLRLVRYQFGNHLGSASLETDDSVAVRVISYEEYHPFGTTSYQGVDKDLKAASKRYRYTGMERDEESGLAYHGARYYIPWLGRWLSADPLGVGGGLNVYAYVNNNPIMAKDPSGMDGETCGVWDEEAAVCYAEPCPMESRADDPAPEPSAPPNVRIRRAPPRPAPPPAPPPPRVIEPPPPVSPTDYSLYVPTGVIYATREEAIREIDNSDNPWWARATLFVLATAATPLALAEEYIARPITNVPFVMQNAGTGIGEHTGRAILWAEQEEYAEATLEGLYVVQDASSGMLAGLSVGAPVAGAVESRLATRALATAESSTATTTTTTATTTEVRVATTEVTEVTTTNARLQQLSQAADAGDIVWMAGDETAFNAYQSSMAAARTTATGRPAFDALRSRMSRRMDIDGPIHHWRYPMTQYGGEAVSAENLYLTSEASHLSIHRAIGTTGAPYRSMSFGAERELQMMFNFWLNP